ncbi:MAG TPA: serine hydrolase [Thermomicrobiales bacterium]|nr:serine hydrolase [Thermomicrobiales bacterium]
MPAPDSTARRALLDRRIAAARAWFPGTFALAARNLDTGEEVLVDGHAPYPTASTYKVPVLIELFRRIEAGEMALSDTLPFRPEALRLGSGVLRDMTVGQAFTLHDLAMLMVIVSDNSATRLLLDHLGGYEAINATTRALGFPSFVLHSPEDRARMEAMGEDNRSLAESSPDDLMAMMARIAEGSMISEAASETMRHMLGRQHYLNQASRYLGRDQYTGDDGAEHPLIWIGSKSGMMDGMRADTGIWRFADGTQIAFATMNEGSADHGYGSEHEGDIVNGVLGWSLASYWWPESLGPMPTVRSAYLDLILSDLA